VQGDKITGICPNHLVPSASGTAPAGPRPFSASISQGVIPNVLLGGKPAAVVKAFGFNSGGHEGIVDAPFATPTSQIGRVITGSATVRIGGQPAATVASQAHCCLPSTPGKVGPGVPNVLIG
jgi:uncharacterized Zn-binding protein involved in type VI secretion